MSAIPPISADHHYHAPLKPEPATARPLPARKEHAQNDEPNGTGARPSGNATASAIDTTA